MQNYLTRNELIAKITEQFSTVPTRQSVNKYLDNITYYDLIKGYKHTLLKNNMGKFIPGLTIDMLYHIHWLNLTLSNILLKCSLEIEKHIKSSLSATVINYGEQPTQYLNKKNYKNASSSVLHYLNQDIDNDYEGHFKNYLVSHNFIPSWFLIQHCSLGRIINWYSILKQYPKTEFTSKFLQHPINTVELRSDEYKKQLLKSFFNFTLEMRNTTAHGNRVFNIKIHENLQKNLLIKAGIEQYFKHDASGNIESDITNFIVIAILLSEIPLFAYNIVNEFILFFENNSNEADNPLYSLNLDAYKLFGVTSKDINRIQNLIKDKFNSQTESV